MNHDNPVIIVGAGRSGTTLLASVLGEHPQLYMAGETSFLAHRLWGEFFSRPAYVDNYRLGKLAQQRAGKGDQPWFDYWEDELGRDLTAAPEISEIRREEEPRLARELGTAVANMLVPPPLRRERWGFKEIWATEASHPGLWRLYDQAFPEARYVQVVRNPLQQVRSVAANRGATFGDDDIVVGLDRWAEIVSYARDLRSTGRYLEVRYEDLTGDGGASLRTILDHAGLGPDPRCNQAMTRRYLPSPPTDLIAGRGDALLARSRAARALAVELGYASEAPT